MEFQNNNYRENAEKENHTLLVRLTKTQKQRLVALAEASGYKTLSDYVRTNLLNPSIETKLNSIISLLQENTRTKCKDNCQEKK